MEKFNPHFHGNFYTITNLDQINTTLLSLYNAAVLQDRDDIAINLTHAMHILSQVREYIKSQPETKDTL